MPATLTFKSYGPLVTGAQVGEVSGTLLIGDVSFLNISNPLNPVVVTVTPDKIRTRAVSKAMADAATGTVFPGIYEKADGLTYRLVSYL
jgi:hypothetical protein